MMIKCADYIECQGCPFFREGECALGILKGDLKCVVEVNKTSEGGAE